MQPTLQPTLLMELTAEAIEAAADLAAIYGDTASGVARVTLGIATKAGMDEEVELWTAILGLLERNELWSPTPPPQAPRWWCSQAFAAKVIER